MTAAPQRQGYAYGLLLRCCPALWFVYGTIVCVLAVANRQALDMPKKTRHTTVLLEMESWDTRGWGAGGAFFLV